MEDLNDNGGLNENRYIIALCFSKMVLGIACYNEETNEIITDSIPTSIEDFDDIITSIKMQFTPSLFLLHPLLVNNEQILPCILSKDFMLENDGKQLDYIVPKTSNWH